MMGLPVAWRQLPQKCCGRDLSNAIGSGTPPCCRTVTQRLSNICVTYMCMATWSWRKKSASTTSPNDLVPHFESWRRLGRRMASSWVVVVMGSWPKLRSSKTQRDAVWATYYHAISTDETPQHDRCPVGDDSWCFYKKALATGQEPGPHRTNVGTPLSVDVAVPVKAVYERLSHDDLLTRCLRGQTQNANESLHSKVWAKCPKIGFACVHRVRSATCAAVAEFNVGVAATMRHLCDVMGIAPGEELLASAKRRDARRLQQAERQMEASTKEARRARRVARAAEAQSTADYAAGAF